MGQQKSRIISGEPEITKKEKAIKEKKKVEQSEIPTSVGKAKKIKKTKKVRTRSKKYQAAKKKLKIKSTTSAKKAIELLKELVDTPFDSTLEAHIALNLKPKETIDLKKIKPDASGVIHLKVGKVSEMTQKLVQKFEDLLEQTLESKASGKKDFIKSIALCTTQSPSIKISLKEFHDSK